MSETKIYKGWVTLQDRGESDNLVCLDDSPACGRPNSDNSIVLAETIAEDLEQNGRFATIRYFVSTIPRTLDELTEDLWKKLYGDVDAEFHVHYSDITGYLWTDEELHVGGHDLLREIHSYMRSWMLLEVTYNKEEPVGASQ
jgi:hypothetical protein